ncbi:conjugative transfer protein MobI(A/C) [Desulfuromonas acetexigens]|uniref:Uncharacterized protein n=1 Tax=Trichloromonas acetexigens TaxID=38815 RepID=A0A550J504_9BACT|nr:conjugative transfer protein MobI(A/C) [Desulfuromonas acetexigens]TRO78314.1 hypothetical protein FL622_16515 [Desulfuromonas acetexigens]
METKTSGKKKSPWRKTETLEAEMAGLGDRTYVVKDLNLEDYLEILSYQVVVLKQQAASYIDPYWENQMRENQRRPVTDRSQLSCRIRLKNDSVYPEWYWNYWVSGTNDKGEPCRRPKGQHIRRGGKGYSYPIQTLLRHSRDWEHEMVTKTEEALTHIRRQNHYLAKARQSIREAIKSCGALESLDESRKDS